MSSSVNAMASSHRTRSAPAGIVGADLATRGIQRSTRNASRVHVTSQRPSTTRASSDTCNRPGPVEATRNALRYAGMTIDDIDLVEINEAFAAQVVPSYQDLGIDLDRLNVNGGAIAVGHPFGMTGARLQNTMLNSLDWHDKSTGLITMCVGGGQGMAMILERVS